MIYDLLLGAALAGRKVVRLKGGDPSIFGRSAEEIEHLRVHHVPVHVVPGITAASAAAASAGISLTLRGMARRLQFVPAQDRKSVGKGRSVSVRVDVGGRRILKN